jgi:four helix bundle protein
VESVKADTAEGYVRKNYQQEYIYFLVISYKSVCELIDHLKTFLLTKSLKNEKKYLERLDKLGRKLNLLIQTIQAGNISEL